MIRTLAAAAVLSMIATAAHADPCTAPVTGYKAGAEVSGLVVYVGDGDGLCVGRGPDPSGWVEIRLADFYAPELSEPGGEAAKAMLERLAMGKAAVCTATAGHDGRTYSYDRLIASCRIGGEDLGEMMRRAGVREGGRGR